MIETRGMEIAIDFISILYWFSFWANKTKACDDDMYIM